MMIEIEKLKNEMNPNLSKRVVCYLSENIFTYNDILVDNELFKLAHLAFMEILKNNLSFARFKFLLILLKEEIEEETLEEMIDEMKSVENVEQLFDKVLRLLKEYNSLSNYDIIIKVLVNHFMYNHGYSLVVFYPFYIGVLNYHIANGMEDDGIKSLLTTIYNQSYQLNTIYEIKTTDEIVRIICSVQDVLEHQVFVSHLYLFGSYCLGTQTKFSDVDIYIEPIVDNIVSINDFLTTVLGIKVNVSLEKDFITYKMIEVF
jgi:predicted nucleotidyltransferase